MIRLRVIQLHIYWYYGFGLEPNIPRHISKHHRCQMCVVFSKGHMMLSFNSYPPPQAPWGFSAWGLPSSLRGSAPAGSRYMMLFYYIFSLVWLYHFCLLHTCMFMVIILTLYISLKYIIWFFKSLINLHTFILQRLEKDQIISS